MYDPNIKVKDTLHSDCLLHDVVESMARSGKVTVEEAWKVEESLWPSLEVVQ